MLTPELSISALVSSLVGTERRRLLEWDKNASKCATSKLFWLGNIYGLRPCTLIYQHIIFLEQLTWFLWELPYKTLLDPDIGSWWSHRSAAWMSSIIPFSVPWSIRIQRGTPSTTIACNLIIYTVKPLYGEQTWDSTKWALCAQRCLPKSIAKVIIFTLPFQNVFHSTTEIPNCLVKFLRLLAFDTWISFNFFNKLIFYADIFTT